MTGWARRIRGAIGVGLTWAVCWGVCGFLIGASSLLLPFLPWEIFFNVFDAPLPALAIPGFFGGVIFSIVLSVLGHDRKFHELSIKRFAAWGAVGGLLLLLVPVLAFSAAPGEFARLLPALAVIAGPFAVLGALSASGSLLVARKAEGKVLGGGDEPRMLNE